MAGLTPGARFLLRFLPPLLLPALLLHSVYHLLEQYRYVSVNATPRWSAIILSYPLAFATWTLTRMVQQWIETERLGAQLVPVANGWLPGNVDVMYRLANSQKKKKYLGE